MRRRVLADPTVLYRSASRSLFLRLADAGFYEFRWSSLIVDSARRWIVAKAPEVSARDLNGIWSSIYEAYPEATILDEEVHEKAESLMVSVPPSGDLHVLAAAVAGEVDSVVTTDLSNVSRAPFGQFGIAVLSLDMLLCQCWRHNELSVLQVFIEQAVERSYTVDEMFHRLISPLRNVAPEFVENVLGVFEENASLQARVSHRLGSSSSP